MPVPLSAAISRNDTRQISAMAQKNETSLTTRFISSILNFRVAYMRRAAFASSSYLAGREICLRRG